MNATETFNLWSRGWATFMGHGLIESTVIYAVVGGLWLLLRNRRWASAQLGYGLFLLVLLKLVVPAQFSIPEIFSSLLPSAQISATGEESGFDPWEMLMGVGGLGEEASTAVAVPGQTVAAEVQPPFMVTLPTVLMLCWAVIVSAFLIRFCWVEWRTRRMFRNTEPLDSLRIRIDLQDLQRIAGVKQPLRWVTGSWVKSPLTYGLLHPIVAVPQGISEEYTASQIRWILLHELAHIRRRDALVSSVQRILQILFFFHPVVWLTNWTIDQLREFACDDIALSGSEAARKDCGDVFLSVVAQANGLPTVIPATLGIINYKTTIRRRLMRILDSKRNLQARMSMREILFLVLVFLVALPFATVATGNENEVEGTIAPKSLTVPLPNLPEGAKPLEMVLIPAGTFTMGSPKDDPGRFSVEGKESEWLPHKVTISQPFYLGKYEITQAQWHIIMGRNPSSDNAKAQEGKTYGVGDDYPVYYVSWDNCQAFVKQLNGLGQGTFRLPTEAEWEYACRAGTDTHFFFGDALECDDEVEYCDIMDQFMWWRGNNTHGGNTKGTKRVGLKLANPWGLHDIHGNVYERCSDWWEDPSERGPQVDPQGPTSGSSRVLRGASWFSFSQSCRSAHRADSPPSSNTQAIGLRLVREAR